MIRRVIVAQAQDGFQQLSDSSTEIRPISASKGNRVAPGSIDRLDQVGLIKTVRMRENHYPAIEWLEKGLPGEKMEAMLLLGFRRFVNTIPNADRLNKAVDSALVELPGMVRKRHNRPLTTARTSFPSAAALPRPCRNACPLQAKHASLKFVSMY